VFARLAAEIKQGNDASWFDALVDAEYRSGLKEQAVEHCARILEISQDAGAARRLFEKVFPGKTDTAEVWWTFLRQHQPNQPAGARLKLIARLLEGKGDAQDLVSLTEAAERQIKNLSLEEADRWWLALAEAALLARQNELAETLLGKANTPGALLKLGDLLADRKQWDRAAQRYYQAWDKDREHTLTRDLRRDHSLALPLYLSGRALVLAGQEKEGKERQELAQWLPLGDEEVRFPLINALSQRHLTQAARRQNELQLRLSQPGSYYSGEAVRRQALEALQNKDYLRAADAHERAMLRVLGSGVVFVQKAAYLGVPSMIARQRASGLVAAGKFAEGMREVAVSQEALPGNIELPILLIPELEKQGHKKEAEALFAQALGVYDKICKDYPKCAWAHNSVGWLSACCKRNLDSALKHAEKAVELAPDVAGHRDTLAEVHFQRGEQEQAVREQKKVVEQAPKRVYFRKQLQRLQAGDRNAPLPAEDDEDD
jgi:tetratricopeptide (TPR) repeat protein